MRRDSGSGAGWPWDVSVRSRLSGGGVLGGANRRLGGQLAWLQPGQCRTLRREPSIISDSVGQLYDTTPSGGTLTYTSTDRARPAHP